MRALKAALEGLEVVDPYGEIERCIGDLNELADYAENNSGSIAGVSMESIFKSFKQTDFLVGGRAEQYKFAMEEVSAGVWAIIVAAAVAIVVALKKFYDWAFGGKSSSSGGHVTNTVETVQKNKEATKKHRVKATALNDALKSEKLELSDVATEDMSTNIAQLTGSRKHIESMEDVLALYIKEDADIDPAWQFVMVRRDGFSDDILNNGPYTKMVTDIINLVQNGQFSQSHNHEVQEELERLMKNTEGSTAADFDKLNDKLGDYDHIKVGGLGADYKTVDDLVVAAKKNHRDLTSKFVEGRVHMDDLHAKLEIQLAGATMQHIAQAAESVKKITVESEKHYEHFHIEASVQNHESTNGERNGDREGAEKHRAMSVTMKHMSKFSRNICEMTRILYIYSKGLLKIMELLRNAGVLALKILNSTVLPRVKNEESKERIKGLGQELRTALNAYAF